jgi:hypothetical protein
MVLLHRRQPFWNGTSKRDRNVEERMDPCRVEDDHFRSGMSCVSLAHTGGRNSVCCFCSCCSASCCCCCVAVLLPARLPTRRRTTTTLLPPLAPPLCGSHKQHTTRMFSLFHLLYRCWPQKLRVDLQSCEPCFC